ncbi:Uncharacterised protein [Serratia marcescens]|nr:Uncharacterised protein [Serratia marcescens]
MPAEGQHCPLQHAGGIGGRIARLINAPAFRQRGAGAAMQFDFAARRRAGGHVEQKRRPIRTRPAESDGVGAEQRSRTAGRRHPRVAGRAGQGHQPLFGQRFDVGPQRGEMHAAVDRQRGDAIGAHLLDKDRQSGAVGQQGKRAAGVGAQDGRRLVEQPGHRIGRDLACPQRSHAAQQPV